MKVCTWKYKPPVKGYQARWHSGCHWSSLFKDSRWGYCPFCGGKMKKEKDVTEDKPA